MAEALNKLRPDQSQAEAWNELWRIVAEKLAERGTQDDRSDHLLQGEHVESE
jgi:hypothetical protein